MRTRLDRASDRTVRCAHHRGMSLTTGLTVDLHLPDLRLRPTTG
jgi:hypothetical protein